MATCGTCGNQTTRLQTEFTRDGKPLPSPIDRCPYCSPERFEKFAAPSDRRGYMGWEAYPNMYDRREKADGSTVYVAKDEMRADTEAWIASAGRKEQQAKQEEALAQKKRNRRTKQLSPAEKQEILNRLGPRIESEQRRRRAELAGIELL